MGRYSRLPLPHRQALNEVMVFTKRVPKGAQETPAAYMRALRVALGMPQAVLAERSGLTQPHVAKLESGKLDAQLGTWRRVFDAMYCDLLVLPRPRKRPGDVLAEIRLLDPEKRPWRP